MIAVFDLDGTLADIAHRLHFVDAGSGRRKNWRAFFAACVEDTPVEPIVAIARRLRGDAHADPGDPGTVDRAFEIWIATGRSDEVRQQTVDWLARHDTPCDRLIMRAAGDFTPDHVLKERWLLEGTLPRERIAVVFDDRARVVRMWRAQGLTCLQVADDGG